MENKSLLNENQVSDNAKISSSRENQRFKGVDFPDPDSVLISNEVIIEENVTIMPFVVITGKSVIKKGSVIYSFSTIEDSTVGENCKIGPNARLRPDSIIENDCRIGNFVEVKNSRIGKNTRAAHLSYVGDAEVGESCNIGCGVVFCNFDGNKKHKTTVGRNCFIGSNVNLVAPLSIGDGSFIAAGTTVTRNIPENSFVVGNRCVKTVVKSEKHNP